VEANSNAMDAVKSAPLRNSDRVIAVAAYEQEEEAAPRPHAFSSERGESSGSSVAICRLDITACTTAEIAKPRTNAHNICQNMTNAIESAAHSAIRGANRSITHAQ